MSNTENNVLFIPISVTAFPHSLPVSPLKVCWLEIKKDMYVEF